MEDTLTDIKWLRAWWTVVIIACLAFIPLASGNRTIMFFGESLLPYIQSVRFPGGDFVVISKDGHVPIEFAHHTEK